MLWCVYLLDKPNTKAVREKNQEAHSAYLKVVDPVCFFTGPLQTDDGTGIVGSLWIISADSRADAQTFVENEPFYKAGVFESVKYHRMRRGHFHPELAGESRSLKQLLALLPEKR